MKATKKAFEKKMKKLGTEQIIELIKATWDDDFGIVFRECGFDILEERHGEQFVDETYDKLWHICEA